MIPPDEAPAAASAEPTGIRDDGPVLPSRGPARLPFLLVWSGAALAAGTLLTLPDALLAGALAALVLAGAWHDLASYRLPDRVTGAIALLGLGNAAWPAVTEGQAAPLLDAGIRMAGVALGLWGLRALHARLRGRIGLGLGDVKLAAAGAAWLALEELATALLMACLAALLAVAARQIRARFGGCPARAGAAEADGPVFIPFGAFLGPALWLVWLLAALPPHAG